MVKNRKDLTPRRSFRASAASGRARTVQTANVKVVVRVRPHNARELGDNFKTVVKVSDEQTLTFDPDEDNTPFFYHGVQQKGRDLLKKQNKNMRFTFDRVFDDKADNEEVFRHSTCDLIDVLMDGCNCSVFVYGATGAGKTHTMLGHNSAPGITYLTMRELFAHRERLSEERDFELAVSYLEVYNENVLDLLKPGGAPLHLREDAKVGVIVAGITLKRIENPEELFELLERGNRCRTQHPTDANAESSRSHAVFQVYIRMNIKTTGQTRLAKLSMIDLAGSERGAATGCKGARFTEGANINKSLLALGNCINSLADGQRHVPYRDSKLTRILKDSLGGNCQTVMIANVSPSSLSFEDTYNTLKYATRAKKIKSNVKKNVVNSELNPRQYMKIIEELNKEIARLKGASECEACKTRTASASSSQIQLPTPANRDDERTLKNHFEEYAKFQERLCRLRANKNLLEVRVDLKEQANRRLSDFCVDTPDKEKGHQKLEQAMERLRRQASGVSSDVQILHSNIGALRERITTFVQAHPELGTVAQLEQAKVDLVRNSIEIEELQNAYKLQEKEMQTRGTLLEEMARLLQPYYLLLRGHGIVTEAMTAEYQNLCKLLQGACTVSFEDGDAAPMELLNRTIVKSEEESRPTKRKLPPSSELEQTFVLGSSSAPNKNCADYILSKALPSPAKKPAKFMRSSPRVRAKENQTTAAAARRKPVGTMGTASRFPSSQSLTRPKLTQRPAKA